MCVCVRACVRACVRVCVRACVIKYYTVCTYIRTNLCPFSFFFFFFEELVTRFAVCMGMQGFTK